MVETKMKSLVDLLKPLIEKWAPSDQVEAIDHCVKYWSTNQWGTGELIKCETLLEAALTAADGTLDSVVEHRLSTLFGAFDEKVPEERFKNSILGKLDRAGGSMLDETQYTENEAPSEDAMAAAKEFASLEGCPWQPELKSFPTTKIIRWTTTRAVNFKDINRIVKFLSASQHFKKRVYHVHTGAHCKNGVIGTAQPAFSLFDMQQIFDANLKAGVMQINN